MTADARFRFEPAGVDGRTRLAASRCPDCVRVHFPAAQQCPACGAATVALWLTGPAKVVFATEILNQPPDSLVVAPYSIGVAEFPEGLRVIGLLEEPAPKLGDSVVPVVVQPAVDLIAFAFRLTSETA